MAISGRVSSSVGTATVGESWAPLVGDRMAKSPPPREVEQLAQKSLRRGPASLIRHLGGIGVAALGAGSSVVVNNLPAATLLASKRRHDGFRNSASEEARSCGAYRPKEGPEPVLACYLRIEGGS